ncbi:non-ribosomal peptide synthetase [Streptomyces sp. RTd22]|uniref:non-ribosomal peptide synthetase n=1 Tax=Streptomyces sp. RTd22 TaxID=1841249 RepID=UPI000A41E2E9|nr:non-ribosomal peptide synthetase [Streptomyces sp. RTd22]
MATHTGTPPHPNHRTRPDAVPVPDAAPPPGAGHSVLPSRRHLSGQGRFCHALIADLPGPVDAGTLRQRLADAARRWGLATELRLHETAVPAPGDAPAARERLRREALRPVRAELSPLRAVLLSYGDGSAHLVLVGVRGRVTRTALERLADIVVTDAAAGPEGPYSGAGSALPPAARWAPVDWGLGDPAARGIVSARPLTLPRAALSGHQLLGAAALATARYQGEPTAEIGHLDTRPGAPEGARVRTVAVDEDLPPAGFLARLGGAPEQAAPEPPAVGLVVSDPAADGRTRLPSLAPVFPLSLHCAERPDGTVEAAAWYDEGVIAPDVAEWFCRSVEHAAAQLAAGGDSAPLAALPVLPAEAAREVLRLGGAERDGEPEGGERIDRRFEAVASRRPDAVALVDEHEELTYRQLNERADAMAAGLHGLGIAPGTMVGVCLDRTASLVVALLAVLKAGCAYVPMDYRHPEDRLRYTAENAGLLLVIGEPGRFPATPGVRVVGVDELGRAPAAAAARRTSPDEAAYVIYTSGSTGRPKGVVVPHRNVTALLAATSADFGLGPDDVWTLFHSSAFDFSVWEIWGCLLTGGRLVVVPYWTARDTDEFHRLLAERRVTVLNQTPSAFAQLVRADRTTPRELSVRLLVFGGEPLDVRVLAPWFARHSPTWCRAVNMFGITETTVHVTAQTVTPAELVAGSRSVGRPLPGWFLSVRDAKGRVLPPGAAGEIYVGGAGVADRYLGQPELTAQRFVVDEATGERLYRSGDKGRLRPDGSLDHLGRLDNQVKIRGYRIELDEIRSVLAGDPAVSAAVVVAGQATPGDSASSRIDAYVVLDERHGPAADTGRLLANARRILPDYMVPSTLTVIPAVPLTPNGKPDVAQLPPPAVHDRAAGRQRDDADDSDGGRTAGTAPADGVAREILEIWGQALRAQVTHEDNFFELGGNSLLVVHVLTTLRERGLPGVPLRDFYAHSTAGEFIRLVEGLHADAVADGDAVPVPRG